MKPYTVSVEVDLPRERFLELYLDPANLPRWPSTCAYDFTHVMLRVMGAVAPGMFRRQNQKFLDNFKAFAEGQGA